MAISVISAWKRIKPETSPNKGRHKTAARALPAGFSGHWSVYRAAKQPEVASTIERRLGLGCENRYSKKPDLL
jgi:hypothetical protein